jgi:exosortase/archaeosortase
LTITSMLTNAEVLKEISEVKALSQLLSVLYFPFSEITPITPAVGS